MSPTLNLAVRVASGDPFDVREFSVRESMSSLFEVTVLALSSSASVDFEAVVGKPARFEIALGLGARSGDGRSAVAPYRVFSGICSELVEVAAEEGGLSTYRLRVVPSLWLATQRRNHRMFQQLSEPDIALELLAEWGVEPLVKIDKPAYKRRKYRVQYGESDYAFLSRMLEDAGISHYFDDEEGESRLVLSDAPQANEPRQGAIPFIDRPTVADREHVTGVRVARRVRPGRYTMRDHDFRRPPTYKLMASAAAPGGGVEDRLERFHYTPGAFLFGVDKGDDTPSADDKGKARTDEAEAAILAKKRLAAKRGDASAVSFSTNAHDLAPGTVVCIVGHPREDLGPNRRLLIVESELSGRSDGEWSHRCEARFADAPYRPELKSPRPKISGVESATVVGPPGEEIHCDEFGRVRVHFHWDRESAMDDNSSCWIHVSQPWGGAGFGASNLPRVGQEVLVDFLGGDPDRPVITGRVYTNLQKVPYKLPDNKTQSGWKSNSTGGSGGYNEIMFEDGGGRELLRMQAERDLSKLVKNNEDSTVGNNRTRQVKNNESVTIGNDRTKLVRNNEDVTIGNNLTKLVKSNEREVTGTNRSVVVGVNRSTQIGAVDSTIVGTTHSVMVSPPGEGGGGAATSSVMEHQKIVFTTGSGASITLEGSKVTIQAATVEIVADSALSATSTGTAVLDGKGHLTVTSSGGDVLIQGGPFVKINP